MGHFDNLRPLLLSSPGQGWLCPLLGQFHILSGLCDSAHGQSEWLLWSHWTCGVCLSQADGLGFLRTDKFMMTTRPMGLTCLQGGWGQCKVAAGPGRAEAKLSRVLSLPHSLHDERPQALRDERPQPLWH